MKKITPIALFLCLANSSVFAADFSDVKTETADVTISRPASKIEFSISPRTDLLAGVISPTEADKTVLADIVLRSTENNEPLRMGMRWKRGVPGQTVLELNNNSAHQAVIDGAWDSTNKLKMSLWFQNSQWVGTLADGYLTMVTPAAALNNATLTAPERQTIAPDVYKITLEASVYK
ncbi:hypothetical protein OR233_004440 [Enterobacter asburiae]|nr:hypothetical protein [Enterobacter asburiae]